MKKYISLILTFCIIILMFSNMVVYAFDQTKVAIEYFEDGSYIVTVIETVFSSRSTKTKTITEYYYDASNNLDWKASLTASFYYDGSTSSCTSASIGHQIYDTSWRLTSSSCSKNSATATGNFTFKKYSLGIPIKTVNKTLTLTCDPNGNVT